MRFPILLVALSCVASVTYAAKPARGYDDLVQCAAYMRITASTQHEDGDEENAAYSALLSRNLQKRAEAVAGKVGRPKAMVEIDIVKTRAGLLSRMAGLYGEEHDAFAADMENGCATVIGMD